MTDGTFRRAACAAPLGLALVLLLAAPPAPAFNDDSLGECTTLPGGVGTGILCESDNDCIAGQICQTTAAEGAISVNLAGRLCMNPADAAENILKRAVCKASVLNLVPPQSDTRGRRLTGQQFFSMCNRHRNLARSCIAAAERTETKLLRNAQDRSVVSPERSENATQSRDNARLERAEDVGNCTNGGNQEPPLNTWQEDGGTYPGNVDETSLGGPACQSCETVRDLLESASNVEIGVLCGPELGLCRVDGELTNVFCQDNRTCEDFPDFTGIIEVCDFTPDVE